MCAQDGLSATRNVKHKKRAMYGRKTSDGKIFHGWNSKYPMACATWRACNAMAGREASILGCQALNFWWYQRGGPKVTARLFRRSCRSFRSWKTAACCWNGFWLKLEWILAFVDSGAESFRLAWGADNEFAGDACYVFCNNMQRITPCLTWPGNARDALHTRVVSIVWCCSMCFDDLWWDQTSSSKNNQCNLAPFNAQHKKVLCAAKVPCRYQADAAMWPPLLMAKSWNGMCHHGDSMRFLIFLQSCWSCMILLHMQRSERTWQLLPPALEVRRLLFMKLQHLRWFQLLCWM